MVEAMANAKPMDWQQFFTFKRKDSLMRVSPWHSIKQSVHHNNTECTEGNNIEPENRRRGTDGKPLCEHCKRLNASSR